MQRSRRCRRHERAARKAGAGRVAAVARQWYRYGESGALEIADGAYTITDLKGKPISKNSGKGGDVTHVANFLASARGETKPNSEIAEGHRSTLLCHLGNIAHRTGRSLRCDPKDGRILDDPKAMELWSREYAPGWEPRV